MVKVVLAGRSWPGFGEMRMLEIIDVVAGILPMTRCLLVVSFKWTDNNLPIPLHEPPLIWSPLVRVWPLQKLMKLAGSLG
jgi:hypothetical protein